MASRLTGALLALVLAGCTTVGPDYEAPEDRPLPADWAPEASPDSIEQAGTWWTLFEDPILEELIEVARTQNLSLEAAGLRILQARAALGIADGLRYPQQQTVSGNAARIYREEDDFNSATLAFDVGWEIDVWGRYARNIESAEASLYATVASYDDILVSILAEVATNYINYRTFQERMLLTEQNIAIQERVVELTQAQFDSGSVSELDVQQASTQLYNTQATLPALKTGMAKTRNALAALLAILPDEVNAILAQGDQELDDSRYLVDTSGGVDDFNKKEDYLSAYQENPIVPVAPAISTTIAADLVRRRPDIRIAELQARSRSAQIGLAEADLYPSFLLVGSVGVSQTVPSGDSFSFSDAVTANIGPAFNWDIFQYGRVKNQIRIQDALFQESLTNYNQSVVRAVQEVSNALADYEFSREQGDYNLNAVRSSVRAFNLSLTQYNNGLVTYQRLLSTIEKMTLSEDRYAQIKGQIATSVVSLYQALGGGWQVRNGQPFVNDDIARQMQLRTDWGDYFEPGDPTPQPDDEEEAP